MKITLTIMTVLLVAVLGFVCSFGCFQQRIATVQNEKTYRVPQLNGDDLYLNESELDNVSPFGWAMMLDIVNDKATHEAYERQCQKDPELAKEVERLFEMKAMIEEAKKQHKNRQRLLP